MKKQEEQQMKFKYTEAVITFFMCNINIVCLQTFENVLCHFEPTIGCSLSTVIEKSYTFIESPWKESECVCTVLCVGSGEGGKEGVLGVGLHDAKYY